MGIEREAVLILHGRDGGSGSPPPAPTPALLARLALAAPEVMEAEGGCTAYVFRSPREADAAPTERDWELLGLCAELRGFARLVESAGLPAAARVCGQGAEMLMAAAIAEYLAASPET